MRRLAAIVTGIVCVVVLAVQAQAGFTGKWRGETATGRPIVLDAAVKKSVVSGTITVGPNSSPLAEGKAEEKQMTFTITLEGRTAACTARLIGDALELTVEGVQDPVTLTRVKDAR